MEMEEIHAVQACRVGVASNGSNNDQHEKQDRDLKIMASNNNNIVRVGANDDLLAGSVSNRLRGWHHSSRIIRVSRASGGKDRHSKVWTSKGLRDRRVRLSVTTAIQFYDLQDRLGYDQPSKAVEWLIKAASDAISELPELDSPFPETPRQPSDGKRSSGDTTEQGGLDSAENELDVAALQQQQNLSLSKSACSSTSETSKGSGLSLSRSDIRESRVKRREKARERTAKEKEKEGIAADHHQNVNPMSQNSSFTELLAGAAGGGISIVTNHPVTVSQSAHSEPNFFPKQQQAVRQWPIAPMDYFGSNSSAFPGHIQLGNSFPQAFNHGGDNHPELQQFPFVTDHHLMGTPASHHQQQSAANFSISCPSSSGLATYNRGTLQSNSPSPSLMVPHLQRFTQLDGSSSSSNFPFFIGTATAPPMENHHHQFPASLQLYYNDGSSSRHSDHKGKGKN